MSDLPSLNSSLNGGAKKKSPPKNRGFGGSGANSKKSPESNRFEESLGDDLDPLDDIMASYEESSSQKKLPNLNTNVAKKSSSGGTKQAS